MEDANLIVGVRNSNVKMIDPNNVIAGDNKMFNSIPQYQDMFIHVELIAKRRGRSVLYTSNNGSVITENDSADDVVVNFMGVNQNINDPNYLNFTTNYYDGSTGSYDTDESFGISSIKVTVNSSYIPQVEIKFVDLRGLSFFNQENSKYRILFDFPPPIFELTIKGYYGMALKYKLHLVRYTTEFDSNSGNYVIDANFTAMTFAPLTDILFRYIINFGIINQEFSIDSNPNVRPINTFDFLQKLKHLYVAINNEIKGSNENKELVRITENVNSIDDIFNMLENFEHDTIFETYKPKLISRTLDSDNNGDMYVTTFGAYNEIISKYATEYEPVKIPDKLYITYILSKNDSVDNISTPNNDFIEKYKNKLLKLLNKYKIKLLDSVELLSSIVDIDSNSITSADVLLTSNINVATRGESDNEFIYLGIDITTFYNQLFKEKNKLSESKNNIAKEISNMVNEMVQSKLGMELSIKNVFDIILDDVDGFFRKLRKTAIDAENKNVDGERFRKFGGKNGKDYNVEKIGENKEVNKVYAFPLFVEKQQNNCVTTEVRVAPIKLAETYDVPEMNLVMEFIETFTKQAQLTKLADIRNQKNDDGTNIWIPLTPFDSKFNGLFEDKSPYYFLASGAISTSTLTTQANVLLTLLNRYYAVSQNSLFNTFIKGDNTGNAYVKFHARAEAINLVTSLTTSKHIDLIKTYLLKYKTNLSGLYEEFNKYDSGGNEYVKLGVETNSNFYIDKDGSNFVGCNFSDNPVNAQIFNKDSTKPIDKFNADLKKTGIKNLWGLLGQNPEFYYSFTEENLLYINDSHKEPSIKLRYEYHKHNGIDINTRYLSNVKIGYGRMGLITRGNDNNKAVDIESNSDMKGTPKLDVSQNMVYLWNWGLTYPYFRNILNEDNASVFQALILVSNFASVLGPFNVDSVNLNKSVFNTPAIIEIPKFLALYIGAILEIRNHPIDNDRLLNDLNEPIPNLSSFNLNKYNLNWTGKYIKADYNDFNEYLSMNDKQLFIGYFNDFYTNTSVGGYNRTISRVKELIIDVNNSEAPFNDKEDDNYFGTQIVINRLINPNYTKGDNKYFIDIILPLIERINLINYSQLTFLPEKFNTLPKKYINIDDFNKKNEDNLKVSNLFFTEFLNNVENELNPKEDKLKEEDRNLRKITEDVDIITEVYYSFKNINDKWLAGSDNSLDGYPFIKNGTLKDYFIYVDRAMNYIGDNIINAEILLEAAEDPNISIFSVISQILSVNGFEFFPLQNFMSHTQTSWIKSFKIETSAIPADNSFFMCMYIGGAAGYPTDVGNGFKDDGIISFETEELTDFSSNDCNKNNTQLKRINKHANFKYADVYAFKVKFGEQNQSIFKDIKIDSKEYKDTNESIQILSRLAGDGTNVVPVPKGQNLYNLYQNRSYKATVNSLGNVMIQPTQYFQLENVPLFNGVYVILSVEHIITPNKMLTSFTGTKLSKYPKPMVNSSFAYSNPDFTNQSAGQNVQAIMADRISLARAEQLDSVFGIDVSHHQENGNLTLAMNGRSSDEPEIKFVIIKLSEGRTYNDPKAVFFANQAKKLGLKIGYYHYAYQYTGDDFIGNATEQASFFVDSIAKLNVPEPNFPLFLDIENNETSDRYWGMDKSKNDLWINTFISTLKGKGYDTIIYSNKPFFDKHTSNNFGNIPLWHAQYPQSPERINPTIASGWNNKGWVAWQFSAGGRLAGFKTDVDLNLMKKDFFNSHST